ncbi:uncharacterized protein C8Q71DRAFT_572171 [Rhodofomes roseus]|uniref:Uncharacterized protein n=1 Tax=Rhodofomes roseus TaxID=34475 RepID=A0ABQ8KJI2_9APHY|nr:uncharacterized protein C8Q71DRAFT_572171 [Rhodofomes roseus]KAH9838001.1 hypothetical protein C8Q71DRAFT_572171 [Rhodofomes roseus]
MARLDFLVRFQRAAPSDSTQGIHGHLRERGGLPRTAGCPAYGLGAEARGDSDKGTGRHKASSKSVPRYHPPSLYQGEYVFSSAAMYDGSTGISVSQLFDYWKGRFDLSCMDTFGESRNPEAPAPLNTIAARVSEGIRGVMQNLKASVVPSDYHSPCEDPRCVGIPFSRLYLEAMHSRDMIDWTVQVYAAFPPGEGPCTNAPCPNEPSSRCLLYRWASSPDSESDV